MPQINVELKDPTHKHFQFASESGENVKREKKVSFKEEIKASSYFKLSSIFVMA